MPRLAGSFMLRFWRTARSQRIEIEHIQSGEKGLVATISEAADWISSRSNDTPPGSERSGEDANQAMEPVEGGDTTLTTLES